MNSCQTSVVMRAGHRAMSRRGFGLGCAMAACAVAAGRDAGAPGSGAPDARVSGAGGSGIDAAIERAHAEFWRRFIDPRWHTLYDHAGMDGEVVLPTAEECRAAKPNALSWDISVTDGAMLGGLYLEGAIDRWRLTGAVADRDKARRIAGGLMKLASVGETRGFIARGLSADGGAHYALGSNDQTLPWMYGMWRYLRSAIPDEAERRRVKAEIIEVAEALRDRGWKVPGDRAPFDSFGSFAGFDWNGAPRLLFLLKMVVDASGDPAWEDLYRKTIDERPPSRKAGRLEICARGMVSARETHHTWTACPGVAALRGLWELERDPALRSAYERGLRASAAVAAESLPLAREFDNDDRRTFLLDWRALNGIWREQRSVKEALDLAREQLRLLDSLSPRRDYEVRLMREPLFAAWVITLCPDPEVLRRHAPAIVDAIRHYRYERLYTSQFFPAELAYYRLRLAGVLGGTPAAGGG